MLFPYCDAEILFRTTECLENIPILFWVDESDETYITDRDWAFVG